MRRLARLSMYLGTAVVVLGLGLFHAEVIGFYDLSGSSRFGWSMAYVALLCVSAYGVGLPDLPRNAYQALWTALAGAALAATGISLVQLATGSQLLPRFVVFWSALFLVPGWTLSAFVAAKDRRRQVGRDRVVVVAGHDDAEALAGDLRRRAERRAQLVAVLPPEQGGRLGEVAAEVDATVVVLAREAQSDDSVVEQAAGLHEAGVRVRTLSLFYDEWLGKLPLSELERVALMFDIGEVHRVRYGRVKRAFDALVGLAAMVAFLACIPLVALGNLVANRGPLLFRQARVGRHDTTFRIYKFRTMRPDQGPSTWTSAQDPRVTPFGRFLRRTHLDELPQAINLVRGELSTVGPRPEQPHYVEDLAGKIRFYRLRHLVRPGVTGWAQVKYEYGASELDALEKLQYEFWYLRHQDLGLDLRILGRTIRSVVGRGGR